MGRLARLPDLRNNHVVKFPGEAAERLAHSLLDMGPSTAADLATRLQMTSAGIRRQLGALQEFGLVAAAERAPYGPAPSPRRGRPSLVFSLTAAGRSALSDTYDDLGIAALRFVQQNLGDEGIAAFAQQRATVLVETLGIGSSMDCGDVDIEATVLEMALSLTGAGYAASVDTGDSAVTVQLCQHNCPIVDAAAEFPELCDAETAALGVALGRHVTRLATLAHGDGVCTTVIPRENPVRESSRDMSNRKASA